MHLTAYEFLILNQSADTRVGDMAIGHLMETLRKSPHAATMTAVTWPKGWRSQGAAIITPGNTMLVLVGDEGPDVRGAQYRFDLIRVGQTVKALEVDPAYHLTVAGVDPIKAAVWSLLGEWGNTMDREALDSLL